MGRELEGRGGKQMALPKSGRLEVQEERSQIRLWESPRGRFPVAGKGGRERRGLSYSKSWKSEGQKIGFA